ESLGGRAPKPRPGTAIPGRRSPGVRARRHRHGDTTRPAAQGRAKASAIDSWSEYCCGAVGMPRLLTVAKVCRYKPKAAILASNSLRWGLPSGVRGKTFCHRALAPALSPLARATRPAQ